MFFLKTMPPLQINQGQNKGRAQDDVSPTCPSPGVWMRSSSQLWRQVIDPNCPIRYCKARKSELTPDPGRRRSAARGCTCRPLFNLGRHKDRQKARGFCFRILVQTKRTTWLFKVYQWMQNHSHRTWSSAFSRKVLVWAKSHTHTLLYQQKNLKVLWVIWMASHLYCPKTLSTVATNLVQPYHDLNLSESPGSRRFAPLLPAVPCRADPQFHWSNLHVSSAVGSEPYLLTAG